MKKILIGIGVFIPLGIVLIIAILIYDLKKNIKYIVKLKSIDLSNISKGVLKATLSLEVNNSSSIDINGKNLIAKIFYNNEEIAETDILSVVKISKKSITKIDLPFSAILDSNTGNLVIFLISKKSIPLKIQIKGKVYFIPIDTNIDYIYKPWKR